MTRLALRPVRRPRIDDAVYFCLRRLLRAKVSYKAGRALAHCPLAEFSCITNTKKRPLIRAFVSLHLFQKGNE